MTNNESNETMRGRRGSTDRLGGRARPVWTKGALMRVRKRLLVAVFVATVGLTVGGGAAHADTVPGPTLGEARAVFEAGFAGGAAIIVHSNSIHGAPAQIAPSATGPRITPLRPFEYCGAGWHVIAVAGFAFATDFPGGKQEMADFMAGVSMHYLLDGHALETQRTALKPALGLPDAFAVTFGAFLAPGTLTVGVHQLVTTVVASGEPDEVTQTEFTIVNC